MCISCQSKHELKRNVIKNLDCQIKNDVSFKIELTYLRDHEWIQKICLRFFIFCLAQTNNPLNVRDLGFWPLILYKLDPPPLLEIWGVYRYFEFSVFSLKWINKPIKIWLILDYCTSQELNYTIKIYSQFQ